jgi:NADH dehydrogenase
METRMADTGPGAGPSPGASRQTAERTAEQTPLATIFGGSGFVGRYVAQRLARRGWRVRVAVRRPNEALFVKTYGALGQVAPVQANIRDDASCRAAIEGATAVVYSVGVLYNAGRNTFEAVQAQGPDRVARLAAEAGAARFALVSAIGADPDSPSDYARTKAAGEAAVRAHIPEAVILRPSVVFGPEDQFFNRFAAMARLSPVLPVVGAETKFQPVYVDDVAQAVVRACCGEAEPGATYELGGPEAETFRELMHRLLRQICRKRAIVEIPRDLALFQGRVLEQIAKIGLAPPITRDQVKLLAKDNVVAPGAKTFADLGITPKTMAAVLPTYLYCYRPYGQYDRDEPQGQE